MMRYLLPMLLLVAVGCGNPKPVNSSFPVTSKDARRALKDMSARPAQLQRPLVIIGGYMDPNVSPTCLRLAFKKHTGDQRIIGVPVGLYDSFEDCRRKVIAAVDKAFPSTDPQWTTEVDVIGASLGGLVARYAAAPCRDADHPRRLHIARLFTIASPHSGAKLAKLAALNQIQADMRPGSEFLHYLAQCDVSAGYELYPYARLKDNLVGEQYASPPGVNPLWLPTGLFEGGHSGAWHDPRILADIARRLRGEPPFSTTPASPLP